MAQRNKRRSNKPKEITYKDIEKALEGRDINNLNYDDLAHLDKLGFGDWIGRNIGNIAQTVGGVGLAAILFCNKFCSCIFLACNALASSVATF